MTCDNPSKIKTKVYTLNTLTGTYYIKIEYNESESDFIVIFVEGESFADSYYYTKMNFRRFIESEPLFIVLCKNAKDFFHLISNLMDDNNENLVSITEELNENYLILTLKMFISGLKEPLTTNIKLLKKQYDQTTLIKNLYEATKKENSDLKNKIKDHENRYDNLEGELEAIKKENSKLNDNINALENENNKLKCIDRERDGVFEATKKENSDLKNKIKDLGKRINNLEGEIEDIKRKNSKLNDIRDRIFEFTKKENSELKNKIKDLENRINILINRQ